MNKYLLIFSALFLVACGTEEVVTEMEHEDKKEEITETVISELEHDITLIDNDDIILTLLKTNHTVKDNDGTNTVKLTVNIENKTNKTIEMYIKELIIDGVELDDMKTYISDGELKPNENKEATINSYVYDFDIEEELSLTEHIKGRIVYSSYDGMREEVSFNEYINE